MARARWCFVPPRLGRALSPVVRRGRCSKCSVQDVVAKSLGSTNPYNMVRATFDALKEQENPRAVAARRGKKVSEIVARRRDGSAGEADAAGEPA